MKHISAENACFLNDKEWTENKIMVFKPKNKYQIIWQCHNFKNILIQNFPASTISSKDFLNNLNN